MPIPAGLIKLSAAANTRNLKGDISNGKYGQDWVQQTQGGGDVSDGSWTDQNTGYARSDIAARLEAAVAAPSAPSAPVAPAPGGEAPPQPASGGMGALQQSAQGFQELSAPGSVNPNLGTRLQANAMRALSAMAGRNY